MGVDEDTLQQAVRDAVVREVAGPKHMATYLGEILAGQAHAEVIGPLRDATGASGVIVRFGQLIAEWGDPSAVEMSFSVTKSYLSLLTGVAVDRGLITDLHEPVSMRVNDDAFDGPRNTRITWEHLLHQTSEWSGSLWSKPYWADPQGHQTRATPLDEPGTVWAYNDVRINALALALTRLFGCGLADVLRSEVMEPIGASDTWRWHGYDRSTVDIDGQAFPVVSGGAHWGGGLWASAYDHARIGCLYLRNGRWHDCQIVSSAWVDRTTRPCPLNINYGYLWWLNHQCRVFPHAPSTGLCARGNLGRQLIWVDPSRDLVVISRWSDDVKPSPQRHLQSTNSDGQLGHHAPAVRPACVIG